MSAASDSTRRDFLSRTAALGGAAAAATFGFTRAVSAEEMANAITQTASFKIGPGKEKEALGLLQTLTAAVEEKEPGVLAYVAHTSDKDPNQVFFFEVYKDAEAMAAHGQAPHLAVLREAFGSGVFAAPVDIVKMNRVGGFWR